MNVTKIQRLSGQHESLKRFYEACNGSDLCLIAKLPPYGFGDIELNCPTTKLIISDVRVSLLKRISEREKEIKEEATSG